MREDAGVGVVRDCDEGRHRLACRGLGDLALTGSAATKFLFNALAELSYLGARRVSKAANAPSRLYKSTLDAVV